MRPWARPEELPFLCAASRMLEHKLNKTCLEDLLGSPLEFSLGQRKKSNVGNKAG